jgi:hypothetical protein
MADVQTSEEDAKLQSVSGDCKKFVCFHIFKE